MIDRWWVRGNCIAIEDDGRLLNVSERMTIFFPDDERADSNRAKEICRTCDVKRQCLDDALSEERYRDSPQGIRGGLTGEERIKAKYNRMNRDNARRKRANSV